MTLYGAEIGPLKEGEQLNDGGQEETVKVDKKEF